MIVIYSLPKEHLPLTPEVRLGNRAPGSEMPSLLVSPVASIPAQVSCVQQEDKALPLRGSCSYGDGCDKEGVRVTS